MAPFLKKKWFMLAIFLTPLFAWPWPEFASYNGPLRADILGKIAVMAIFFMNGVTLNKKVLRASAGKIKVMIAIQSICFIAAPLTAFAFVKSYLTFYQFPEEFIAGTYILACLPTTIASSAIFTEIAGGDKEIALFNAVLSNLIGIFFAPIALKTLLPQNDAVLHFNLLPTILELTILIIIPIALGYLLHLKYSVKNEHQALFTPTSKFFLLFIVYSAFCNSIKEAKSSPSPWNEILLLLLGMTLLHAIYLLLSWVIGKCFFTKKKEALAILFTAPQKTVAVGIPLCIALLNATDAANGLGFTTLPLLLYNNIQWLCAGVLSEIKAKNRATKH